MIYNKSCFLESILEIINRCELYLRSEPAFYKLLFSEGRQFSIMLTKQIENITKFCMYFTWHYLLNLVKLCDLVCIYSLILYFADQIKSLQMILEISTWYFRNQCLITISIIIQSLVKLLKWRRSIFRRRAFSVSYTWSMFCKLVDVCLCFYLCS